MDPVLEQAAYAGDVATLRKLLEEDNLLLRRPNTASQPGDNALHIAAMLGHADFVKEILNQNPELASSLNGHGHSPLHLASANGHLAVVKELLSASEGLVLRDREGLLAIHIAAVNNKADVVEELMGACMKSVDERTGSGDTLLHLAVKFNSFQVLEFLVHKLGDDQGGKHDHRQLLMARDAQGNTILHLAAARRQLQMVKLLLSKPWAEVNTLNSRGLTVLDLLLESPMERGDLILMETILAAGGKVSTERRDGDSQQPPPSSRAMSIDVVDTDTTTTCTTTCKSVTMVTIKYLAASIGLGHLVVGAGDNTSTDVVYTDDESHRKKMPKTLMIVATLIATIAFESGVSPPEFKWEFQKINYFTFDITALSASLSVILLLICVMPKTKYFIRVLMWLTWVAVLCVGLAFEQGVELHPYNIFGISWFSVLAILLLWLCAKLVVYILKKFRLCAAATQPQPRCSCGLACRACWPILFVVLFTGGALLHLFAALVKVDCEAGVCYKFITRKVSR